MQNASGKRDFSITDGVAVAMRVLVRWLYVGDSFAIIQLEFRSLRVFRITKMCRRRSVIWKNKENLWLPFFGQRQTTTDGGGARLSITLRPYGVWNQFYWLNCKSHLPGSGQFVARIGALLLLLRRLMACQPFFKRTICCPPRTLNVINLWRAKLAVIIAVNGSSVNLNLK